MKHFFVGAKGGKVSFVDALTGEVRLDIHLEAGMYPIARFAPFRRAGEHIELPGVLVASVGNGRTVKPVGQFESAANPHFRVSPAARQVREMARMMARTEALAKRTEKAANAMARAKAAVPQITSEVASVVAPVAPAAGDAV